MTQDDVNRLLEPHVDAVERLHWKRLYETSISDRELALKAERDALTAEHDAIREAINDPDRIADVGVVKRVRDIVRDFSDLSHYCDRLEAENERIKAEANVLLAEAERHRHEADVRADALAKRWEELKRWVFYSHALCITDAMVVQDAIHDLEQDA